MSRPLVLFIAFTMAALVGCQKARFAAERGEAINPEQIAPFDPNQQQNQQQTQDNFDQNQGQNQDGFTGDGGQAFQLRGTCTADGAPQQLQVNSLSTGRVQLAGELCPRAFGRLNVLFVVDYSGSMRSADPPDTLGLSCGRLRAAKRILEKLKLAKRPDDVITVGEVSFAQAASQRLAMQGIDSFDSILKVNTFNFCGYEDGASGSTNYQAGFDAARAALAGATGNTVIYFLSDGLPTISANGPYDENDAAGVHKQAGANAVTALRNAVPNVAINTVYLNRGSNGAQAEAYLRSISNQFRIVTQAADLADKVVELSIPTVGLSTTTPIALLTAPGATGPQSIPVRTYAPDPARAGVWLFETEPFTPFKQPGQVVRNVFTITARGLDNKEYPNTYWLNVQSQ
jgi:hypothetical protein